MNSNSYLFIFFRISLIIIEFFLFIMLFIFKAPKRKCWVLKAILTLVTIVGLTALLCTPLINFYGAIRFDRTIVSFLTSIVTLFLLAGLVIGMSTCFDISLYELMSNIYIGYSMRQIVFSIYSLLLNAINPDLLLIRIDQQSFSNFIIYILIYGVFLVGGGVIVFLNKKIKRLTLELPIFVILTVTIILNSIITNFSEVISDEHLLSYSFGLLSQILTLGLIIILNFYAQKQIELKTNNEMLSKLLNKQEEQYKFAKANAELMFIKVHDLKHQVAILRKGGEEAEKILSSLESVVSNYESINLTDNRVMNIIVSEKWQYCTKHNIKLSCTVDPDAFKNVDNIHLYSLLGNILDNAIEAVMKIKNKDKRLISLIITKKKGFSILQTHNYFEGDIEMKNGIPLTNKQEKESHGFGIKSIRHIVDMYQGNILLNIDDKIFNLQIVIQD